MRILLTGASGQLGRSLQRVLRDSDLITISRPEYDITKETIVDRICSIEPDIVIHTAAKTDVDECERDPESAYLVNATATKFIATACASCHARLVYISTDYVFDGSKHDSYNEEDPPGPINVYGKTKLAGEKYTQDLVSRNYVIRTAWLYGEGQNNFVKKILGLTGKPPIKVVTTQIGSPTSADDLALAIDKLVQFPEYGIYHLTNEGVCSRFEMAEAILQFSNLGDVPIQPISIYERPAPIPSRIVLKNKRAAALGIVLRPWREALRSFVECQ
jgi:dTDP-4-dehydrorhamnose reductase